MHEKSWEEKIREYCAEFEPLDQELYLKNGEEAAKDYIFDVCSIFEKTCELNLAAKGWVRNSYELQKDKSTIIIVVDLFPPITASPPGRPS